jgi:hypothetical protein
VSVVEAMKVPVEAVRVLIKAVRVSIEIAEEPKKAARVYNTLMSSAVFFTAVRKTAEALKVL